MRLYGFPIFITLLLSYKHFRDKLFQFMLGTECMVLYVDYRIHLASLTATVQNTVLINTLGDIGEKVAPQIFPKNHTSILFPLFFWLVKYYIFTLSFLHIIGHKRCEFLLCTIFILITCVYSFVTGI